MDYSDADLDYARALFMTSGVSPTDCQRKAFSMSLGQLRACQDFCDEFLDTERTQPHPAALLGFNSYAYMIEKAHALQEIAGAIIEARLLAASTPGSNAPKTPTRL